jgi:hypothetical protein
MTGQKLIGLVIRALRYVLAIAMIFVAPPALAMSGNDLLAVCQSGGGEAWGYCIGYVTGITETSSSICVPPETIRAQGRDIVLQYLKNHPETRQLKAADLVLNALKAAWPCPSLR